MFVCFDCGGFGEYEVGVFDCVVVEVDEVLVVGEFILV